MESGIPIAVTQTTNFNAFAGFGVQRPNQVSDPTLPADQRIASRWFDTTAFTTTPQFAIGTASRNPVRGPSYREVDMALIRRVLLNRGMSIEVRLEVFNLFNTVNLGSPNAVQGAANFGRSRRRSIPASDNSASSSYSSRCSIGRWTGRPSPSAFASRSRPR
jgi:hypothetical protein